jgi:hypothetical protein
MDTAHPLGQDSEYQTYPMGRNGYINTMKPELFRYELFKGFSNQNVES